MSALVGAFFGWPIVKRIRSNNNDDEHVDRLNHRYTVGLILAGAVLSSTTSFVINRIACWLPAELKHSSYSKYIENYCYISNTYYIPTNVTPPNTNEERRQLQIGYYQWVPLLLLLISLFFYIPRLFWRSLNHHSGIDIQNLISKSQSSATNAAYILHSYSQIRRKATRKHRGNHLVVLYFITRLFYLINSIVQLILLHRLLGHRGGAWLLDLDIIYSILRYGNPLLDSPYFPRIALCDVQIREIAEIHRYTLQCALPINMLNEKIFFGLSLWFSYVILHNLFAFFYLIFQQIPSVRERYIYRLIDIAGENRDGSMAQFFDDHSTLDMIFLLRLIDHHWGEFQTIEVMKEFFKRRQR